MSHEAKARIIPHGEKAQILDYAIKAAGSIDAPSSPEAFARFCRNLLGIDEKHGLFGDEIHQLVDKLGLPPTAFFNPGNHWTLVVTPGTEQMRVYDPVSGVQDVSTDTNKHIYYSMSKGLMRLSKDGFWNFGRLLEDNYSLPEEPLQQLGGLQTDAWNCGPLAVYAATLAHGEKRLLETNKV